jgi:hypothetical protein
MMIATVPTEPGSKYELVLRKVISGIQVMIYRRDGTPIRDRNEVKTDLLLRIAELDGNKEEWRKRMIELAAYAIFATASDGERNGHGF